MKNVKMKKRILAGAFFLPVFLMVTIFKIRGIYPFGDTSLLTFDMSQQYIEFLGYLKYVADGHQNVYYSLAQSLGGETISLFAYYLMSPFNIFFIVLHDNLVLALTIVTVLKVACSGLTMSIFLNQKHCKYEAIAFSMCYALMGYSVVYASNLMWLDGVVGLPLVMCGIEKMQEQYRISKTYVLALCYCLVSNFYIGYMVCIMSVLYLIYLNIRDARNSKERGKGIISYVGGSLLGAGIGGILLIPTAYAMQGTKEGVSVNSVVTLGQLHTVKECVIRLFCGSWNTKDVLLGAPVLYCGTFILWMVVGFFWNAKIRLREKIAAAFLCLIMLLSALSKGLDMVWHVFNEPNCYPGRYAFFISFLFVMWAYENYCRWDKKKSNCYVIVGFLYFLMAFALKAENGIHLHYIVLTTFLAMLIIVLHGILNKRNQMILVLTVLISADLVCNMWMSMKQLPFEAASAFENSYYPDVKEAIDTVKMEDTSLFRMEKTFSRQNDNYNEAFLYNYAGVSSFSSTTKDSLKQFAGQLGYRDNFLKIIYGDGSTDFVDSLIGIRYVLSLQKLPELECVKNVNGVYIYRNPQALSLAVGDLEGKCFWTKSKEDDTFKFQNAIFESLTQTDEPLLEEITPEKIEYDNMQQDKMLTQTDPALDGKITYYLRAKEKGYFYFRITGEANGVFVNEKALNGYQTFDDWEIGKIYAEEPGEVVTVTVDVVPGGCELEPLTFYQQNQMLYEEEMMELQEKSLAVTAETSSRLNMQVDITEDGNGILLTIPYDKAWQCYVDGKKTDVKRVYNEFMGITLNKGKHDVELKYELKGEKEGAWLSVLSLIVFIWVIFREKKGRVKNEV